MRGQVVQQRLVLRTQRPQSERRPIAQPLDRLEMLRVRRDGRPCRKFVVGRYDAHPGIEDDHTDSIREQWVDVELADLRVIGGKLAEAYQCLHDSLDIRG